jgi:hypothetical protein
MFYSGVLNIGMQAGYARREPPPTGFFHRSMRCDTSIRPYTHTRSKHSNKSRKMSLSPDQVDLYSLTMNAMRRKSTKAILPSRRQPQNPMSYQ